VLAAFATHKRTHMRLAIAAACLAVTLPAAAEASGPACGAFVLVGSEKGINVIDNAPAGKSPGDVRAGWRKLADEAGNPIGAVHFVATLTEPGAEGGDILSGQYFIRLPDGYIASQTVYQLPDSTDTSQKAQNAILVVTGGTGPFAGASGTIEIVAGTAPRYVFDLDCP
jgi:hypothetical protein